MPARWSGLAAASGRRRCVATLYIAGLRVNLSDACSLVRDTMDGSQPPDPEHSSDPCSLVRDTIDGSQPRGGPLGGCKTINGSGR